MDALMMMDWKWTAMRSFLQSVGRLSDGVRLGWERGFDSGESMEYIYRNRPSGRWGIGWLGDWLYLQQVGCRGLRGRKALLQAALRETIQANRTAGRPTHVLDVAGGPAHYLLEVFDRDRGDDLSAELRDLDANGLARGRVRARELGVRHVRYVKADALDPAQFTNLDPAPNVAIASGFYEILLNDAQVKQSLRLIAQALPPGGRLIFTTQVQHPQLELIANVLTNRHGQPWVMKLRAAERVEGWAEDAGFTGCVTATEPLGLFTVTTATRT